MNSLKEYITEKFQVSKDNVGQYTYTPKDKYELIKYIEEKIKKEGLGTQNEPLDLNDIDTSKITDMSSLFDTLDGELRTLSWNGHFDISDWDVSNVKNMMLMFRRSRFDGDLSGWDVSNVKDIYGMFAESEFSAENGDISGWDVSEVANMNYMFYDSPLEKNPPKWYKTYEIIK